jgi:glycosyltransferase involved in cell wall biosynthesis
MRLKMEYKNKFYAGMISTVKPRKCGIAKFNGDLYDSIKNDERIEDLGFYSIIREKLDYAPKIGKLVEREINQDRKDSWDKALEDILSKTEYRKSHGINSGYFFQHEYGIFGKDHDSDDNIVNMLKTLKENNIPTITITHTLERKMSDFKNDVMRGIIENTDKIVCLTPSAIKRFNELYDIPKGKLPRGRLIYVPHGVPRVEITENQDELKKEYGFFDKKKNSPRYLVSNVGLLSDGKGIEYALEGFSEFLKSKPKDNPIYCVAGATHPDKKREEGEKYRNKCIKLAKDLGLKVINSNGGKRKKDFSNYNVVFWDNYLSDLEYLKFMKMSDVGLVTNKGKDQISSGQIAYWVGMERPVITTESPYAKDMEDEGVGLLIGFENSEDVADRLKSHNSLPLGGKEELKLLAAGKGATMTWPIVGKTYTNLMESLIRYHNDKKK